MKEFKNNGAAAIILAAGRGKRMGGTVQKQYLTLDGKPLLYYAVKEFEESIAERIVLVAGEAELPYCRDEIVNKYGFHKVCSIIAGGKERYHSVWEGLQALSEDAPQYVMIHDGARPFPDQGIIERTLRDASEFGASVAAMPVKDTIKIASPQGFAASTPDRSLLWQVQTPQVFLYEWIRNAYEKLMSREEYQKGITDDAMVLESMMGRHVKLTEGSYENIKVTTPEDMAIAGAILNRRKLNNF